MPVTAPARPQEDLAEKIEIIKKDDHTVIKTSINRLDLRPALGAMFNKDSAKATEQDKSKQPASPKQPAKANADKLRVLDFYVDIRELLLPGDIAIEDVGSFFAYEDYQADKKDEGIFYFIANLGSSVGADLLLGLKRLKFDGVLLNKNKRTKISINMAPIDSTQRAVLIRASDANAMMRMIGVPNFVGDNYVMHAKWFDGKKSKDDWIITGTIRLKDFYIEKPALLVRAFGAVFSLQGLVNSLTSNRAYFEKMEFVFKIKKNKREIHCRAYFGPETPVSCGSF